MPLIGNTLKPLAKSFLILLGLMAATDAAIHEKVFRSGFSTLTISNEEIDGITKIVKSLKEPGLLINGVNETIKNKAKEQKGVFLSMLLGTVGASLLGNLLTSKGAIATSQGQGTIRIGKGAIRAGGIF